MDSKLKSKPLPVPVAAGADCGNTVLTAAATSIPAKLARPFLAISFLLPGIAIVVIAAHFPEAGSVPVHEADVAQPLGALPQIELRQDKSNWPAMFAGDRLALPFGRQQHIRVVERRERQVG